MKEVSVRFGKYTLNTDRFKPTVVEDVMADDTYFDFKYKEEKSREPKRWDVAVDDICFEFDNEETAKQFHSFCISC